jgi:hypothetical protein
MHGLEKEELIKSIMCSRKRTFIAFVVFWCNSIETTRLKWCFVLKSFNKMDFIQKRLPLQYKIKSAANKLFVHCNCGLATQPIHTNAFAHNN